MEQNELPRPSSRCPILSSADWSAQLRTVAGKGGRHLVVTGRVTVRTGGYRLRLLLGPTMEIMPPIQIVMLEATRPAGKVTQAIVTRDVRGEFPALEGYGAVVVRCGNDTLATIRPVRRVS